MLGWKSMVEFLMICSLRTWQNINTGMHGHLFSPIMMNVKESNLCCHLQGMVLLEIIGFFPSLYQHSKRLGREAIGKMFGRAGEQINFFSSFTV